MASPTPVIHTGVWKGKVCSYTVAEWAMRLQRHKSYVSSVLLELEDSLCPVEQLITRSAEARKFDRKKRVISVDRVSVTAKLINAMAARRVI